MYIEVGIEMPSDMLNENNSNITPTNKKQYNELSWNRTPRKPRKESPDLFQQLLKERDTGDDQSYKFFEQYHQNENMQNFNPFQEDNNNEVYVQNNIQIQIQNEGMQIEVANQNSNYNQQQQSNHQIQQQQQQKISSQQQQLEQQSSNMKSNQKPQQNQADNIIYKEEYNIIQNSQQNTNNQINKSNSNEKIQEESNNNNNEENGLFSGCNCKKSRCLKLYCECFANQGYCSEGCNCFECGNKQHNDDEREKAIQEALLRNPEAFSIKAVEQKPVKKGCSCKKTHCKKKYCECYGSGTVCSSFCKCEGCQNLKEEDRQSNYTVSTQETPNSCDLLEEKTKYKKKARASSCKIMNNLDNVQSSCSNNDKIINLQSSQKILSDIEQQQQQLNLNPNKENLI